jgi:hypothetical protein
LQLIRAENGAESEHDAHVAAFADRLRQLALAEPLPLKLPEIAAPSNGT